MARPVSRRQFLRADFRAECAALRPPWALAEDVFVEQCTRCGDCVRACPQDILQADADGFPKIEFARAACTFCGECVEVCASSALTRSTLGSPIPSQVWLARAEVDHRCLTQQGVCCEICRDQCAPRAILFRPAIGKAPTPHVDFARCTGCGACVSPCPAHAIRVSRPGLAAENKIRIHTTEASCT